MFKFYLDLLENKTFGIFTLLDNQCKMKNPNLMNFVNTVKSTHQNSQVFTEVRPNPAKTECNSFIVRHFAHDVQYTTVKF